MQPLQKQHKHDYLRELHSRARRWLNDSHADVSSVRRARRIVNDFNNSAQGALHFDSTGTDITLTPTPLSSRAGYGHVYAILHHDITQGVYIGWTIQPLQERLWQHWTDKRCGAGTRERTIHYEMHRK